MTKDRLHRAQIGAILHHMRGAGMAQHVRRSSASRISRGSPHHLPDTLARQLVALRARQKAKANSFIDATVAPLRFPCQPETGRALVRYSAERILSRSPQRNHALLVALAAHQHVSCLELQVFKFSIDDFRNPQRSRIENLQHGAIAGSQRGRLLRVARCNALAPSGAASVASISSRASAFGKTFHCRGDSMSSVGS